MKKIAIIDYVFANINWFYIVILISNIFLLNDIRAYEYFIL